MIGRFISPDSLYPDIYDPQSLDRYSYCLNNPLKYTDPDGNSPKSAIVKWSRKAWNHVFDRHVDKDIFKKKNKFKSQDPDTIGKQTDEVVSKPDKVTKQEKERTLYEKDLGTDVGDNGETIQRVCLSKNKELITTYPSKKFKATAALIVGTFIEVMIDILDPIGADGLDIDQDEIEIMKRNKELLNKSLEEKDVSQNNEENDDDSTEL